MTNTTFPLKIIETDILILGSGGAGLFAALHAHQANANLQITIAVKRAIRKVWLYPHGTRRVQRCAGCR